MAPRKIRMSRPPRSSPRRVILTPRRKEKIRDFKREIVKTSQANPGSYTWILALKDFMDEEDVTVADIRRWINTHKWIVLDDPARPARQSGRCGATNFHKQQETWQTHATDTNNGQSVYDISQNLQTQWPQLYQQYMIIPANYIQPGNSNNTGNGGPPQFILPNCKNWSQPQPLESTEPQEGSILSDMSSDLSLGMAYLGDLSRVCGRHNQLWSCLVYIEKMFNVMQRAQKRCVLVLSHKDALAAAVVSKQTKMVKLEIVENFEMAGRCSVTLAATEDIAPVEVDLSDADD